MDFDILVLLHIVFPLLEMPFSNNSLCCLQDLAQMVLMMFYVFLNVVSPVAESLSSWYLQHLAHGGSVESICLVAG